MGWRERTEVLRRWYQQDLAAVDVDGERRVHGLGAGVSGEAMVSIGDVAVGGRLQGEATGQCGIS